MPCTSPMRRYPRSARFARPQVVSGAHRFPHLLQSICLSGVSCRASRRQCAVAQHVAATAVADFLPFANQHTVSPPHMRARRHITPNVELAAGLTPP